jgi:hypothetical protein
MFANVEQLSDGTFVVADNFRGWSSLLHFSSTGTYLDEHLREGEGPGEAKSIESVLTVGDSLWVIDRGLRRCTLLDSTFAYVRSFTCHESATDAATLNGKLIFTGFGPIGLVEYDDANGIRILVWSDHDPVPVSDDYSTLATGSDGVWFVQHPNQYRLTYWLPGETEPAKTIERRPSWWVRGKPFLLDNMKVGGDPNARQVMAGPILFNIAVHDRFIWTSSYVYTRDNRQYMDFLGDWLNQGLQGDVRIHIEALTPKGELVASAIYDDLPPVRFMPGGLAYTLEKEGHDVKIGIYQPRVVK